MHYHLISLAPFALFLFLFYYINLLLKIKTLVFQTFLCIL
ncbi:hypothetical protein NC652_034136 [Populus alba x Populus x berolinensis]|nr:hypothetical protein NC652_034136 [Populus alba x Populus x berolinensis]